MTLNFSRLFALKMLAVGFAITAMCAAAGAAGFSYTNINGFTVYELDQPTSSALVGGPSTVMTGAGPNGTDAYYRPGNTGGGDDSSQYFWDFTFAGLPNVGQALAPGLYSAQMYVSDYGGLQHENDGVFGSANGAWGYRGLGFWSSWNGVGQGTPGWKSPGDWGTGSGGKVWLSSTGFSDGTTNDVTVGVKWNPWGGYRGLAVSGVRITADPTGEFTAVPEPATGLLVLVGGAMMAVRHRRRA